MDLNHLSLNQIDIMTIDQLFGMLIDRVALAGLEVQTSDIVVAGSEAGQLIAGGSNDNQ